MRPDSPAPAQAEIRQGVWLDSRLALWLAEPRVLVVADLHWGYAASHRARGNLLPVWGDDDIERRLQSLIADHRPREMIWLGDVVHTADGAKHAEAYLRAAPVPVTLLAGNHDRRWRERGAAHCARAGYFFHHGDQTVAVPPDHVEVVGHHHPAASWSDGAGGRLRLPALVASARRWVLPAFSPWAAGAAWTPATDETLWVISPRRIFALPNAPASAKVVVS